MNDIPFPGEENEVPHAGETEQSTVPSELKDLPVPGHFAARPSSDEEKTDTLKPDYSFIPDQPQEKPKEPVESQTLSEEETQEFNSFFKEETPEENNAVPMHARPPEKGRPRRKKGEGFLGIPNILVTIVWAAITLSVGITLGRLLWVCATDVLAFGRQDRTVTITVYESDTIDDITDKLYKGKLIRYPGLFRFYASFAVDEGDIKPGIWDLNTMYDYHALVKMMAPSSIKEVVKITIPEGYTCRQIFELMQDNKVCTIQSIADYAANGELGEYWFLEGIERGDKYCLEGFLFPDTYEFYKNENPAVVLDKMLQNFDTRFPEELQKKIPAINERITKMMRKDGRKEDYIKDHQLDVRQIITIASIVEKESAGAAEAPDIASVIFNRLFAWNGTPSYLNCDATIVYALGGKTNLTADDLQIDSPYNTYTHVGLTPGPISNPGLSSIKAALEPSKTSYYFYVLDPSVGEHHFSNTIEEHNAFRANLGG